MKKFLSFSFKTLVLLITVLGINYISGFSTTAKAADPKLSNVSVQKGKKTEIKVTGLDISQYRSLKWSSDDKSIATVSSKGVITGKSTGKAKITLYIKDTDTELTGTVTVVSYFKTKSVKIKNKPKSFITVGSKVKLSAKVTPSKAKYKKIIWSSSKPSVASISSKGTIKARKKGTTIITAAVENTSKEVSFKLRVKNPIKLKKLKISGNDSVTVGETLQLKAEYTPRNSTQKDVEWYTNKKDIATVNQDGLVYSHAPGKVTITAKEKNSKKKAKYKITVLPIPVAGINFASDNIKSMETGTKCKLSVQIAPWNASNKELTWKTSNKTAATVDEDGTVTALRPIECVDITATSKDNKNLSCTWTLKITKNGGYITKSTLDDLDLTIIDNVMFVAHPDDETLWGAGHLLEDEYLVICMTHGWNDARRAAFTDAMKKTNDKYIILDYPDTRKSLSGGKYETDLLSTCRSSLQKDIETVLSYKKWNKVVTHNPRGEYGKYLHQQISKEVTAAYNKHSKDHAELWYFGRFYDVNNIPGEQIDSTLLAIKRTMIDRYYATASGAIKAFGHMIPYENWVLSSEWK